jgi:elongation factor 1 alpha-like protein
VVRAAQQGRGAPRGAVTQPGQLPPGLLQAAASIRISGSDTSTATESSGGGGSAAAARAAPYDFKSYVREPWEVAATGSGGGHRPPLHVVAMGHVDAGKSSAMGRLLAACGAMSPAQARAAQKAAQGAGNAPDAWAWSLDTRAEERERGVTMDVALARIPQGEGGDASGPPIVILDAPGHRDFVPAALEAASRSDVALLFVDASLGAFEAGMGLGGPGSGSGHHGAAPHGGQTVEHAALARACGCAHLVVVVNKMDVVAWEQSRFDAVRSLLEPALKAAGWKDSAVTWVPCAGREGINLHAPVGRVHPGHPLAAWWPADRHCVLSAARSAHVAGAPLLGPLGLPVWEMLTSAGGQEGKALGPLACGGRVTSGALRVGQAVVLSPSGASATVKALHAGGVAVATAVAGDDVEVGLSTLTAPPHGAHIAAPALFPGCVLCPASHSAPAAARLTLRIMVMSTVRVPLMRGTTVTLHLGAAREPATVSSLTVELDPKTWEQRRQRPRCLARGSGGVIEVTPERPIAAERFDDCPALGRVALREGGATLAVGVVTRVWTAAEIA